MSPIVRLGLFVLLVLAAAVWVSADNGEYASMVRAFLRQLFRQLF